MDETEWRKREKELIRRIADICDELWESGDRMSLQYKLLLKQESQDTRNKLAAHRINKYVLLGHGVTKTFTDTPGAISAHYQR